tara:strand:- start:15065 stop:15835 length:771 start_codon:yes stop_codon:yes gene_type:complete
MTQLRDYHNKVKFKLLHEYITYLQENDLNDTIFDIGVGRGGDMHKWNKCGVQNVYGIDPSKASIFDAIKRYKNIEHLKKRNYKFFFYRKSEGFLNIFNKKVKQEINKVNIISCMFAFHYFFMNDWALSSFFTNCNTILEKDGFILITVPDGNVITNLLQDKLNYQNNAIKIDKAEYKCKGLGDAIDFFLSDTIYFGEKLVSKEYLVFYETLKCYADKYGFKIIKNTTFHEYIVPELEDNDDIIASGINKIYVLQKL